MIIEGTIRDNLKLVCANASEEELIQAAAHAGILQFISVKEMAGLSKARGVAVGAGLGGSMKSHLSKSSSEKFDKFGKDKEKNAEFKFIEKQESLSERVRARKPNNDSISDVGSLDLSNIPLEFRADQSNSQFHLNILEEETERDYDDSATYESSSDEVFFPDSPEITISSLSRLKTPLKKRSEPKIKEHDHNNYSNNTLREDGEREIASSRREFFKEEGSTSDPFPISKGALLSRSVSVPICITPTSGNNSPSQTDSPSAKRDRSESSKSPTRRSLDRERDRDREIIYNSNHIRENTPSSFTPSSPGKEREFLQTGTHPAYKNNNNNNKRENSGARENHKEHVSREKERGYTRPDNLSVLDIPVRPESISRGLMQAIGIARIFLRKEARIIILNDAEGALDPLKLREIVFPNLWNFVDKNNILLVVISKNYSAIRELDCILVFDQQSGTIVHSGTHKELLKQQARLYIEFMFPWKAIPDPAKKNNRNEKLTETPDVGSPWIT